MPRSQETTHPCPPTLFPGLVIQKIWDLKKITLLITLVLIFCYLINLILFSSRGYCESDFLLLMWVKLYIDCKYFPCFCFLGDFAKGTMKKIRSTFLLFNWLQSPYSVMICSDSKILFPSSPTCFPSPSPFDLWLGRFCFGVNLDFFTWLPGNRSHPIRDAYKC